MNIARRFYWLADKAFALHTLASLAALAWLALQGLAVGAGLIAILWLLTAVIWREWTNA